MNNHFYTAAAADNLTPSLDEVSPVKEFTLKSRLFRGNIALERLHQYSSPIIGEAGLAVRGEFVRRIQKALRILLPQYGHSVLVPQASNLTTHPYPINSIFDSRTTHLVKLYQAALGLDVDGLVGPNTLLAMDAELDRIYYYGIDEHRERIHHDRSISTMLDMYTVVYGITASTCIDVWDIPDQGNGTSIGELHLGDTVYVNQRVVWADAAPGVESDWLFIKTKGPATDDDSDSGVEGYVQRYQIWTKSPMPDPDAKLVKVVQGMTMEQDIINVYYTGGALQNNDKRYYANALMAVNNPTGNKWVDGVVNGERETVFLNPAKFPAINLALLPFTWPAHIAGLANWSLDALYAALGIPVMAYDDIQLFAGSPGTDQYIWVPGASYADAMHNTVAPFSYWGQAGALFEDVMEAAYQSLVVALDKVWRPGFGIAIESGIGATFGIPLRVSTDSSFYIWRDDQGDFRIRKSGIIRFGLDSGVGAGFYLGGGRKATADTPEKKGYGLGAEIAAEVQLGLQVGVIEEYLFPLRFDWHLISLFTLAASSVSAKAELAVWALKLFGGMNLDPRQYLTFSQFYFGGFATGAAGVQGGLRVGTGTEAARWTSTTGNPLDADRQSMLSWKGLLSLLHASLGGAIEGKAAQVIEYEVRSLTGATEVRDSDYLIEPHSGYRIPRRARMHVQYEASVMAEVNLALPLLGILGIPIPAGFALGHGGFFRTTYEYDYDTMMTYFDLDGNLATPISQIGGLTVGPKMEFKEYGVGYKSGELDYYRSPASEYYLSLDHTAMKNINSVSDLLDVVGSVFIEKRVRYGGLLAPSSHVSFRKFQAQLPAMIKNNYRKNYGAIVQGFVTSKFVGSGADFKTGIAKLVEIIRAEKQLPWGEILLDLIKWYFFGDYYIMKFLYGIMDLKESELHFEVGGSIAAGGQLSGGAKVRLDGHLSVVATYDLDIRDTIEEIITSDDPAGTILDVLIDLKEDAEYVVDVVRNVSALALPAPLHFPLLPPTP